MIGHPLLSFTSGSQVVVVTPTQPQAGGTAKKSAKRRWWRIGDRLYKATVAEMEAAVASMVETAEPPALPSKPAPQVEVPAQLVQVPDLPVWEWDWRPVYLNAAFQRDLELMAILEASIRRRMEDEEDAIMALLLH